MRIGDELVTLAEEYGEIAKRSPPKQIELWACLGRLLETSLGSADLHALLGGHKFIAEVRLSSSVVPDADTVLSELQRDRIAGTLAASITDAAVAYDLAEDGETLRCTHADGRVSYGSLVDGEFVER